MVTKASRFSFEETVATLRDAMARGGATIFATIDQASAAASVGMKLRPTTLIVFGNPKAGTPLMDAFPSIAFELPMKFLVWEEGGTVTIAYEPLAEIAARYAVTNMDERIEAIDRGMETLSGTVAA